MDAQLMVLLKEWLNAKQLVSENPRLLLENVDNSPECRRRLDVLKEAELNLRKCGSQTIQELNDWIKNPAPDCECLNNTNPARQHRNCAKRKKLHMTAELRLRSFAEKIQLQ